MTDVPKTNEQLSKEYFKVVAAYAGNLVTCIRQKKTIACADINIADFYHSHGKTLDDFQYYRIGKRTKYVLELILENGVEEAGRQVAEQRIHDMRQQTIRKSYRTAEQSVDLNYDWNGEPIQKLDEIIKKCEED